MGLAYEQKGMPAEAIAELEKAGSLSKQGSVNNLASLGNAYAIAGQKSKARQIVAELHPLAVPLLTHKQFIDIRVFLENPPVDLVFPYFLAVPCLSRKWRKSSSAKISGNAAVAAAGSTLKIVDVQ
jgi:hypothetical protein